MGKIEFYSNSYSVRSFVGKLVAQYLIFSFLMLFIASMCFVAISYKISTDQEILLISREVHPMINVLLQTYFIDAYFSYFASVVDSLNEGFGLNSIKVVSEQNLNISFLSYDLGKLLVDWRDFPKVTFYIPSIWGGENVYLSLSFIHVVKGYSIILMFFILIILLFISYLISARNISREMNSEIVMPISRIFDGYSDQNLKIFELQKIKKSLVEFQRLENIKNGLMIAKELFHELKFPAFYFYNQLKRITLLRSRDDITFLVDDSLQHGESLLQKMNTTLKQIAVNCDSQLEKKWINLINIVRDVGFKTAKHKSILINGDSFLLRTLFRNLLENALQSGSSIDDISVYFDEHNSVVYVNVNNIVCERSLTPNVSKIFEGGYTTKKDGSGIGLSLCKHIVQIHDGNINATYSSKSRLFSIKMAFNRKMK